MVKVPSAPLALIVALFVATIALWGLIPGGIRAIALAKASDETGALSFTYDFDFSEVEQGSLPVGDGWVVSDLGDGRGQVRVVADPDVNSGRALHIVTNPFQGNRRSIVVRFPQWENPSGDVEVVAYEYKVKWVEGSAGLYTYLNQKGSDHRIILLPGGGRLTWHASLDGGTSTVFDTLRPGWNKIRVIANKTTRSGDIYINDMQTPAARSLPFQRPVDSWDQMRITITHESAPQESRAAYYGDFRVWGLAPDSGLTSAQFNALINEVTGEDWLAQEVPSPGPTPSSVLAAEPPVAFEPWEGMLRPTPDARDAHAAHALGIPFYQAIPIKEGELYPAQLNLPHNHLRQSNGEPIPAVMSSAALWPDGSIRWLAVDGVWPSHLPLNSLDEGVQVFLRGSESEGITVSNTGTDRDDSSESPIKSLTVKDGQVHLLDHKGNVVASLTPRASYIQITQPKVIIPDSVPDDERQYEWAQPLEALNPSGTPRSLNPRIREHIVERETELFTVYRLRGDGGAAFPGNELEWQLRVRIYHDTPIVRLEMSWALHWDPQRFALTQAEWVADLATDLSQVVHSAVDSGLDLALGSVVIQSDPTGRSALSHRGSVLAENEWPAENWDFSVAKGTDGWIGVGIPKFTRLGPNHVAFDNGSITLASWSENFGYGLDLRPSTELDEFGLDSGDDRATAVGVMRTLETSLVWGQNSKAAQDIAGLEARRDTLWFPSRQDLIATAVFGPWTEGQFETNVDYLDDLSATFHFVLASRDHWRWNGWANFGDIRTNFSRGSNPDRGLHPGRWALYGRYGWRNGSSQPYLGMWVSGLALEDREIIMAAVDYAYHVADVDVAHGSFFRPRTTLSGGMHRRNKDHWSGSVQTQYTPSSGLYLTQWLTGKERVRDTLQEVREYSRISRGSSAFAASAWIQRYMETHDPDDLMIAEQLIHEAAAAWERAGTPREEHLWGNLAPDANLRGLAALYKSNFRLTSDGIPTLTEFYDATRDPKYLEAILTTLQAHGVEALNQNLAHYHGFAFLLANGITEEEIGVDLIRTIREHMARLVNTRVPLAREHWTYENLVPVVGGLETTVIGARGKYTPLVLRFFGRPPVEINALSPRFGMNVRGVIPIQLALSNPDRVSLLKGVTIDIDGKVLYEGTRFPDPDELHLDTTQLQEGPHTLTVSALVKDYGNVENQVRFNVTNMWTLVQNMSPPVADGWFGARDFLQTAERSEGWTYETGNSSRFFGDPQRLLRAADTTEYLIWETPALQKAVITLFVRSGVPWEHGVELSISSQGELWTEVDYEIEIDHNADWHRVLLMVNVDGAIRTNWFRLSLLDGVRKEDIQIGEVVLTGYRQ